MAHLNKKIDQIEGKVNQIYKQMEALEVEAKNYLAKSKEAKGSAKEMYKQKCLMALKKKKQLEQQAKSYNSHQNALQQAAFTVENVGHQKQMMATLQGAIQTQKQAMTKIDYDKMDELHDEMLDMKMQSDMMNEMMARNYEVDYDSDEFEDEFMQFQKEVATEKKKNAVIQSDKKQEIKGNNIDDILKM